MQPITINQTSIQTSNLDENEQIKRGMLVLALFVASVYAAVRTTYFTFEKLQLSFQSFSKEDKLKIQPSKITTQLSELNDAQLTKHCQSIELLNYGKILHTHYDITSCGKTAHAISQFVGEKFYQTDVIVDQYLPWNDFLKSFRQPDARVYRIGLHSCNFVNNQTHHWIRFPGHQISIVQYPLQNNSSKRYQVFQSFINLYSLKFYILNIGTPLLNFEELQNKYLSRCYKLASHNGPWTKEIASSFSLLTHTEKSVALQFVGFSPEYGCLSHYFARCVPKPRIYKYLSKEIIHCIPAGILGIGVGLATLGLGILFGRYIFSPNND